MNWRVLLRSSAIILSSFPSFPLFYEAAPDNGDVSPLPKTYFTCSGFEMPKLTARGYETA
ncbi:MAG: hypothetical protein ACTSWP_03645 [Candidatus Freyarchaeota archaeon]